MVLAVVVVLVLVVASVEICAVVVVLVVVLVVLVVLVGVLVVVLARTNKKKSLDPTEQLSKHSSLICITHIPLFIGLVCERLQPNLPKVNISEDQIVPIAGGAPFFAIAKPPFRRDRQKR